VQTLHGHSSGDLLRTAVVYPVEIIIKLYKQDKVVQMRAFASGKKLAEMWEQQAALSRATFLQKTLLQVMLSCIPGSHFVATHPIQDSIFFRAPKKVVQFS